MDPPKARANPHDTTAQSASAEQQARVEQTLGRVLASPAFRNSKQCQKFLRYVIEHSHVGHEDSLKERSIGVELFGRDPDYDTAADPVVRVRATEVRKRLSQYYGESAVEDDVRFEIPQGSYRAEIHSPLPKVEPAAESIVNVPPQVRATGRKWIWLVAIAGTLLAVLVFAMLRRPGLSDVLSVFWAPVLDSPKPVLVYCGQPVVYFLSREVHEKYRETLGAEKQRGSYTITLDPDATLHGRDVIPVTDQFVGIGNAHTAALLSTLFARHQKPVEIRYANDLSFSDLRSSPSVLIGAFSNFWTLEMTGQLRFIFEQQDGVRRIRDRVENRTWQLSNIAPDGKTPEDYAVVTRLFDSATGQMLISAAGITQYGTRAAGEFITDAARLEQALAKAKTDWPKRNLQALLRTTVYKGTPAPPQVITVHVW